MLIGLQRVPINSQSQIDIVEFSVYFPHLDCPYRSTDCSLPVLFHPAENVPTRSCTTAGKAHSPPGENCPYSFTHTNIYKDYKCHIIFYQLKFTFGFTQCWGLRPKRVHPLYNLLEGSRTFEAKRGWQPVCSPPTPLSSRERRLTTQGARILTDKINITLKLNFIIN